MASRVFSGPVPIGCASYSCTTVRVNRYTTLRAMGLSRDSLTWLLSGHYVERAEVAAIASPSLVCHFYSFDLLERAVTLRLTSMMVW